MSDRRDDQAAIAWPGFVDILSAVVIMFVFFLLIVATALYFHIIIFKSKILSAVSAEQVETEYKMEFLQADTEFAESVEQTIRFESENDRLIIFFGRDSISITPDVMEEVNAILAHYQQLGTDRLNIHVNASKNPLTLENISRRMAVARMLNVRNTILANDFPANSIVPSVVTGELIDDTFHWVSIRFEQR